MTVDPRRAVRADIEIHQGRVRGIFARSQSPQHRRLATSATVVDLSGCLVLPGLINAHDHLEFNLFPRLGNGPYSSYEEWAASIYHPDRPPLREQLSVPYEARLWWGALKNLFAGVTTVCHHNPYTPEVFDKDFPVRVVKQFGWAHSLAFAKNIPQAFRSTPADAPFIIHLSEGTDPKSTEEIFALDRLGALDSRTVIVHGVGLDARGHALVRERGAAMVWCPTSNLFTLGKTLDAQTAASIKRLALGNDSALTAKGDLLDEARAANQDMGMKAESTYSLVTNSAANVLRLRDGAGAIRPGGPADLIAIRDSAASPADALVHTSPEQIEMVMVSGKPKLVSPAMATRWPEEFITELEPLAVGGILRLIAAPIRWLAMETRKHLGPQIYLAGKEINL